MSFGASLCTETISFRAIFCTLTMSFWSSSIFPNIFAAQKCIAKTLNMKRSRPSPAIAGTLKPPSTPPTPQNYSTRTRKSISRNTTLRKALIPKIDEPAQNHQLLQWTSLNLPKSELSLPLTFPTGQTFRWRKTGEVQYTGVVRSHLISLKHLEEEEDGDVAYCLHKSRNADLAERDLLDYLNAEICMADLWKEFSDSDERFAELAKYLGGARVLRQDPLECLMQFLCSSNNGIVRITRMVEFLSELGEYLGHVGGFDFYEFPTLDQLSEVSEKELRDAGFGYRCLSVCVLTNLSLFVFNANIVHTVVM